MAHLHPTTIFHVHLALSLLLNEVDKFIAGQPERASETVSIPILSIFIIVPL
jgi:hypothetical protein